MPSRWLIEKKRGGNAPISPLSSALCTHTLHRKKTALKGEGSNIFEKWGQPANCRAGKLAAVLLCACFLPVPSSTPLQNAPSQRATLLCNTQAPSLHTRVSAPWALSGSDTPKAAPTLFLSPYLFLQEMCTRAFMCQANLAHEITHTRVNL